MEPPTGQLRPEIKSLGLFVPAWVLLDDLINVDVKGLINMAGVTFHLVNSEFGRHDSLPRWDLS